jgi:hypothetical protein
MLDGQGLIPSKGKRFFLFHNSQTGSGAHPASNPMDTGALSMVGKVAMA